MMVTRVWIGVMELLGQSLFKLLDLLLSNSVILLQHWLGQGILALVEIC